MAENEESVEAPKETDEGKDETPASQPEAPPSAAEEPQEVHVEEKDKVAEGVAEAETPEESAPDPKSHGDADKPMAEEEAAADMDAKDDGISFVDLDNKEEHVPMVTSVSFADVATRESKEVVRKGRSVTSVMSYDSVTSVPDVEIKAKVILGSIISIRRGSTAGGEYYDRHKMPKYMNSYKLEPDKPFHIEKVEKFMREILTEALENATYDTDKTPKQVKWASSAMRAKLKEQEYDRCKFVCIVTMGEKRSQDVHSIIRFLWDPDRDKFAHVVLENMSIFAVAVCFGIYYE